MSSHHDALQRARSPEYEPRREDLRDEVRPEPQRDGSHVGAVSGNDTPACHSWITPLVIGSESVLPLVGSSEDGAVTLFLGIVRNSNAGRAVHGMRYDAYVEMAESELAAIVREAAQQSGGGVAAVHRIGELAIGDVSVAIAASTPHRAQSFDACRYVIEEIKKRLPVWKREYYTDGDAQWLDGHGPGGR